MKNDRTKLPQHSESLFLTDGGLETTLIFENGIDLPEFAAFPLLETEKGSGILRDYYLPYIEIARKNHLGFILESPTYRASKQWGDLIGLTEKQIQTANIQAIKLLVELRNNHANEDSPMVISGCVGPRGDGYHVNNKMTIEQAKKYHTEQIRTFATATEADLVSAFTLNYVEEAIGISLAARDNAIPSVISFTVETDGRLPSGQPLGSAIEQVDKTTEAGPAYFMINCAHPTHFSDVLKTGGAWIDRIGGVRANASCKSHAELEEAEELDRGDIAELSHQYQQLTELLPKLKVFGGCCGTDHFHIEQICRGIHDTVTA